MTELLSTLLFPLDREAFLKHYQAREYLHVERRSPGYYSKLLGVDCLDTFLQSERLPTAFVNVAKDGVKYPLEEWSRMAASTRGEDRVAIPERLFDLYGEGATLILNQTDRMIPSLNAACRALTFEMGFRVWANIYVTPRQASGFSRHCDDHEVLILQIDGEKHWLLYPPDEPAAEVVLRAGDLLYLPRGLSHSARALEADSIHVTLGLRPSYGFDLVGELAAIAAGDDRFRQPAPPTFAGPDARRQFEAEFLSHVQDLISETSPEELLNRRFLSLAQNQATGWPGRFSDFRMLHRMTPETVVCRRPGILTVIEKDGKSLNVTFAGRQVSVPAFLEPALCKILGENAFAIGEIEGLIGSSGKVKLVGWFVKAGLLRIVAC